MNGNSCDVPSCSSTYNRLRDLGCNEISRIRCHPTWMRIISSRQQCRRSCSRPKSRMSLQSFLFVVLFSIILCSRTVAAENGQIDLSYDRSEPPLLYLGSKTLPNLQPMRRGNGIESQSSQSSPSPTSLPSPFDTSLGNNFTTSSCPAFFRNFLNNPSFQSCHPLSLLLQTSSSFFNIERSRVELTKSLAASCKVDYQRCSTLMASLAQQIQQDSNCGADLGLQNPMAEQAYRAFIAYDPLYHAGCLRDAGGRFCFADAVTNTSAPASSYIYYLPLGMPLPSGAQPTCNTCLRDTMSAFATYAVDGSQSLYNDYPTAAKQVDVSCGAQFVRSVAQPPSSTGPLNPTPGVGRLALLFILVTFLS